MLNPSSFNEWCNVSRSSNTLLTDLFVISPAISKVVCPTTLPLTTETNPPPIFSTVLTANSISSLFVPTTIKLCESCAIVVAMAPFFIPKSFTIALPTLFFVSLCLSITNIFAVLFISGSGIKLPLLSILTSIIHSDVYKLLGITCIVLTFVDFIGISQLISLGIKTFDSLIESEESTASILSSEVSIFLPNL